MESDGTAFRFPVCRALWIAQFVGSIGTCARPSGQSGSWAISLAPRRGCGRADDGDAAALFPLTRPSRTLRLPGRAHSPAFVPFVRFRPGARGEIVESLPAPRCLLFPARGGRMARSAVCPDLVGVDHV